LIYAFLFPLGNLLLYASLFAMQEVARRRRIIPERHAVDSETDKVYLYFQDYKALLIGDPLLSFLDYGVGALLLSEVVLSPSFVVIGIVVLAIGMIIGIYVVHWFYQEVTSRGWKFDPGWNSDGTLSLGGMIHLAYIATQVIIVVVALSLLFYLLTSGRIVNQWPFLLVQFVSLAYLVPAWLDRKEGKGF